MMERISRFLTNYKVLKGKINQVETIKDTFKATFGSLLLTVLILLIPALLIFNLMIFENLTLLLNILTIVLVITFTILYNIFYIKLLKAYHEKLQPVNFTTMIVIESLFIGIILVTVTIIGMTIIG